jgi:hypothetical protein
MAAAFLFPNCNLPIVRRTTEDVPWPWLGGQPDNDDDETGDAA